MALAGSLPCTVMSLAMATFLVSLPAGADEAERVAVPSRTLTDEAFLRGDATAGTVVTLSGTLTLPDGDGDGDGPVPALILLHGTDGPSSGAVRGWAKFLAGIGVATLKLDSFTARGLDQTSSDQSQFGQFTQIYDAYRAVDLLAGDPRIDPDRIALMGFSRGGTATLYASMLRFQASFGSKARIRAYLPFYPACNFQLVGEMEVADVPIREFHGGLDDWTSPSPCRDYVARLAAHGHDAAMTEYPDARHAFDSTSAATYFVIDEAQTSRNCMRREEQFRLLNAATGQPFSYADSCVEYGPSVQYNAAAADVAQLAVKQFLAGIFSEE